MTEGMLRFLEGTVIHGHGKGGPAGFPTANILCNELTLRPEDAGVYAVLAYLPDGTVHVGVTNIGTRPTADAAKTTTIETLILDYSGDLYGQTLRIELLSYLRPIRKFQSMEALKEQIDADSQKARETALKNNRYMEVVSCSSAETQKLGRLLAGFLLHGDVVVLRGDLGAGKSEFARGIARGLGITCPVPSPSFTILNVYEGGNTVLNHFDWYRIEEENELYEMGAEEQINGDGICVIEWAERAENLIPADHLDVIIQTEAENKRRIILLPRGGFHSIEMDQLKEGFTC